MTLQALQLDDDFESTANVDRNDDEKTNVPTELDNGGSDDEGKESTASVKHDHALARDGGKWSGVGNERDDRSQSTDDNSDDIDDDDDDVDDTDTDGDENNEDDDNSDTDSKDSSQEDMNLRFFHRL
jgi:segregation and condensation protein B